MRKCLIPLLLMLLLAACGAPDASPQSPTEVVEPGGSTATEQLPAAASPVATSVGTLPATEPPLPTAPAGTAAETAASTAPAGTPTAGATGGEAAKQYAAPPPLAIDPNKRYTAVISTSQGNVTAELYAQESPQTVNNFVFLAREGFYDGVIFHRVVPGFVIQGGDPTGTGMGGPGYQFDDEPVKRPYEPYSLAMANSGEDTNGSQFFIVLPGGEAQLQPAYNHFGKLTQGQDVVARIAATQLGPDELGQLQRPTTPIAIEGITITEG